MNGAPARITIFLLVALTHLASAAQHRVVVVGGDEALVRALDVALAPWGIETTVLTVPSEGSRDANHARDLARGAHADVVVWVGNTTRGYTLWVYDADARRETERTLEAGPPFDETTAASIALSVKTVLRTSVVAPPEERTIAPPPPPPAKVEEASWRIGAAIGARIAHVAATSVEPRTSLEVSAWPAAFGHRWGLLLEATAGAPVTANVASFHGTLQEGAARLALGARLDLTPSIAVEPSLGGGIALVGLRGNVLPGGASAASTRIDPVVDGRVAVDVAWPSPRVRLGGWAGLGYLTRTQRYLVRGVPVLDPSAVLPEAALRISLGFN